jgi:hypothetical protein
LKLIFTVIALAGADHVCLKIHSADHFIPQTGVAPLAMDGLLVNPALNGIDHMVALGISANTAPDPEGVLILMLYIHCAVATLRAFNTRALICHSLRSTV